MDEVWIPIKGYEGRYDVSNMGNVRSHDTVQTRSNGKVVCNFHIIGRVLKPRYTGRDAKHGKGYATVLIEGKNLKVHRLVAEAFIENPNGYKQVNHIDGDKTNNAASNLEWCNGEQNIYHSLIHGMRPTGEDMENHKLTKEDVRSIRTMYRKGSSVSGAKPLSREYGVSPETIKNIVERKKWRWC